MTLPLFGVCTVILYWMLPGETKPRTKTRIHEMQHVFQGRRNRLFLLSYLIEDVKKGYRESKYEVEARENTEIILRGVRPEWAVDL